MSSKRRKQPSRRPPGLELDPILNRAMELIGAKNDAALARALGMSAPSLSTARRRGSVPYTKLCAFAEKSGESLDWLLLGRSIQAGRGKIEHDLFKQVFRRAYDKAKEVPGTVDLNFVIYSAVSIYNDVLEVSEVAHREAAIQEKATQHAEVLARANLGFLDRQYPDESAIEKAGVKSLRDALREFVERGEEKIKLHGHPSPVRTSAK